MSVDLIFDQSLDTSHPVDLVFGASGGSGGPPAQASFNIALPVPAFFARLGYDNAVSRGVESLTSGSFQDGVSAKSVTQMPYQDATNLRITSDVRSTIADRLIADRAVAFETNDKLANATGVSYQLGQPAEPNSTVVRFESAVSMRSELSARQQEASQVPGATVRLPAQERLRTARPDKRFALQEAQSLIKDLRSSSKLGIKLVKTLTDPFQEARKPPPGMYVRPTPPQPPVGEPCYVPPVGSAVQLLFKDLWTSGNYLLFPCCAQDVGPPALVIVPVRRVYIVINEAALKRVAGNVAIPTFSMSMSLDVDSWTWSFSATIPGDALSIVEPSAYGEPVELEATINGVAYRFLAEKLARERTFNQNALRITGRGKAALLDAPYTGVLSFSNDNARTAEQLFNDVLSVNGVPLGWDVTWEPEDWTVPAGVFSHSGSYMSALNQIAAAAGAYIQPHNTDEAMSVLLRYPIAPWNWASATPDYELPAAVTTREGIEWLDKAIYNRVFVSGVGQGVLGQVTRTGTAGDLVAPMITDALAGLTATSARQRGLPVLADVGRQAAVTLRLPVLAETGVIKPGKLVRYVDGSTVRVGMVRSTSVDVGMPEVFQTIGVETHVI